MWTYESLEKVEQDKKRRQVKCFLTISLLMFISLVLSDKMGLYGWYHIAPAPKTWSEIFGQVHVYLCFSFIAGLFALYFEEMNSDKNMICLKCGKSKERDDKTLCKCGGQFEYLHKLKWVDDKRTKV